MMIMKAIINNTIRKAVFVLLFVSTIATSCSDFLTKPPLTDFTDNNYWTSEANVRAFSWNFYNMFYGYGRSTYGEFYWQTLGNNSYEMKFSEDLLHYTFLGFPTGVYTSNSMWESYYSNIRRANLMITRVSEMESLTEDARNHWLGVGKFFRAMNYFSLLSSWGGVPMPLSYTSPDAAEEIYLPRSDRKTVADQIIKDLNEAATSMKASDGADAINKYSAYALLARVALFEGTFRKYHSLGDYNTYLQQAVTAAEALISSGKFSLADNYKSKWISDDLAGNPEMILYKRYEPNIMCHYLQAHTHCSAPEICGPTKYTVESFVCSDGLPISQSPLYMGDKGIANVKANRDIRLVDMIFDEIGYYGQPIYDILVSSTGYVSSFYDNPAVDKKHPDVTTENRNHTDAPIYTISEIYLILAEAKAELGTLTQTDLDNTINKLRERAGVAKLELSGTDGAMASGVEINDPKRTSSLESATKGGIVSPILWEIRRERRAELLGWVYLRHLDIDRWAKGEYMDTELNPDVMLGAWMEKAPAGYEKNLNADNYINTHSQYSRKFEDKYYLDPIPQDEIILYKDKGIDLTQNAGW